MTRDSISREALFALVWEKPATEAARELGISDVALGKLCRRLDVPKPPRGYWARVKAGQRLERPGLSALNESVGQVAPARQKRRASGRSHASVRLSAKQREYFVRALEELAAAGNDVSACDLVRDGIRNISAELAAQILVLIHRRHERWVSEAGDTVRTRVGAHQRVAKLYDKLMPLAKEQLLILQRESRKGYGSERDRAVIIRLSPDLCRRIGAFHRLVRDNQLAYLAWDLQKIDHGWTFRYVHSPETHGNAVGELCVSEHEIWVRCQIETLWATDEFETDKIPLRDVLPADLLAHAAVELPLVLKRSRLAPYAKPLRALRDAERAYDLIVEATYRMDSAVPDDHLALADRIWFSGTESGPFTAARRAMDDLETDLERWEAHLEAEKAALCQRVLGVAVGDDVVFSAHRKPFRLRLEGASVYLSEDDLAFNLWGKRYRKDGLPGKRYEAVTIRVENDLQ